MRKMIDAALVVSTGGIASLPSVRSFVLRQLSKLCRGRLRRRAVGYDPGRHGVALIVAPHPDDETFGCGGIMLARRERGVQTHVVVLTNGEASHRGHPDLDADELARMRCEETRAAVSALAGPSARVSFLNYADGELSRLSRETEEQLIGELRLLIESLRPEEIFIPCHHEGSNEHDGAHELAVAALAGTRLRPNVYEYVVWGLRYPSLLRAAAKTAGTILRWDSGAQRAVKNRVLRMYRTQVNPTPPWPAPVLPNGFLALFESGEEFFLERPLRRDPLPVKAMAVPLAMRPANGTQQPGRLGRAV